MAILQLAGHDVLTLHMTLPVSGRWVATLDLDTDEVLSGRVTLEDEGVSYACAVVAAGVVAYRARVEVVGGAGGLARTVPARSYNRSTARTILEELLAAVGERLDTTSTPAVLRVSLPFWTRAGGRAADALQALCDVLGARWRVLPNGAVWVGTDPFPKAPKTMEAVELDRDHAARSILLAPDAITLQPGFLLGADRIGRVEHLIERDAPLRTTAWVDA